jgi:riboflavin kinase/FMN adenylyltransferase
MRVEYLLGAEAIAPLGPSVLSIGFFDGVHRGHQRLIARAAELAGRERARPVAVTFWPHPAAILRPDEAPPLLTTLDEKLALMAGLGALDTVVVIPFTPELSQRTPEAFLDLIAGFCEPRALVEGERFALGHDRAGTVAYLRELGARRGFRVESEDVRDASGERVSSSRIRSLLREGHVDEAAALLGRPYTLGGEVARGDQRGRLLGFPTANLRPDAGKALPSNGVYAARVRLPGEGAAGHAAVCNIGVRPTFGGEPRLLVEAHLLDAEMDLYGLPLALELVARLREERRFDGIEALKTQIGADAKRARELLKTDEVDDGVAGRGGAGRDGR